MAATGAATGAIKDTRDSTCTNALPPSAIRALVVSSARGFLTTSKRGHRTFRKVAGGVCRHAKEELGPAGLPWTKAAWEEGLRAAMTRLEALAGTADVRLQQGFEKVLMSIRRAHLEGLQQPANASRGAQRTAASPAPASRAAASQALPQAGGASRKARKARVQLASYLFGDKVPHILLCRECSSPATFAMRGGKQGGDLKCFCGLHRPVRTCCFQIETARAGLAGALLAVVEETDRSDSLNEAGMKKLTDSDVITARPLFRDYVTFTATVLLIICTNYLPRTDKTWSVALRRRLQLVCFVRRYFSPHEKGYDPANPLHGLVDTRLLTKLSTLQNMQELLAWLVAGAVKWYQNGQQLYPMPIRSMDALQDYEEAADDFDNFVLNSCVKGDDLFISTSDALKAYNDPQRMVGSKCVGHIPSLDTKSLKSAMNNHGFSGPDKPSKLGLGVKYCGVTERGYKGLALKSVEVKME